MQIFEGHKFGVVYGFKAFMFSQNFMKTVHLSCPSTSIIHMAVYMLCIVYTLSQVILMIH